jgi:hypothetical protein
MARHSHTTRLERLGRIVAGGLRQRDRRDKNKGARRRCHNVFLHVAADAAIGVILS